MILLQEPPKPYVPKAGQHLQPLPDTLLNTEKKHVRAATEEPKLLKDILAKMGLVDKSI